MNLNRCLINIGSSGAAGTQLRESSLTSLLYQIEEEVAKKSGNSFQIITHQPLFQKIIDDTAVLAAFVVRMAHIINVLDSNGVLYCGMRPENILVDLNEEGA